MLRSLDQLFELGPPLPRAAQDFGVGCPWPRGKERENYRGCILPHLRTPEFNTGVVVLEPSSATFDHMVSSIRELGASDGSDQGFLQRYNRSHNLFRADSLLPHEYNVFAMEEMPRFRQWPWSMPDSERERDGARFVLPSSREAGFSFDHVNVIHFASSFLKPWHPGLPSIAPRTFAALQRARSALREAPIPRACRSQQNQKGGYVVVRATNAVGRISAPAH